MYQRLSSFFQINSIINSRQYGFRPQHSCEHALLDAKNTILHRKQIALLLLIDFSKAFDMVDHTILLGKLSKYGIRGPALQWISSYLHDRTQYVSVNGAISSTMHLKYGVPQGSILGPLLFIIYINDLPRIAPLIHFIMYADDANIIIIGNSMAETQAKANELLKLLANWVSANALKLNVGKTHYMVFSNTNTVTINLELNGSVIHQSHHERFLGVIIDDKLSWKYHHMALANKIVHFLHCPLLTLPTSYIVHFLHCPLLTLSTSYIVHFLHCILSYVANFNARVLVLNSCCQK